MSENKQMTKGEDIVGTFNPSDNEHVAELKRMATEYINYVHKHGNCPRRKALAVSQMESSQMFAVKSLFH